MRPHLHASPASFVAQLRKRVPLRGAELARYKRRQAARRAATATATTTTPSSAGGQVTVSGAGGAGEPSDATAAAQRARMIQRLALTGRVERAEEVALQGGLTWVDEEEAEREGEDEVEAAEADAIEGVDEEGADDVESALAAADARVADDLFAGAPDGTTAGETGGGSSAAMELEGAQQSNADEVAELVCEPDEDHGHEHGHGAPATAPTVPAAAPGGQPGGGGGAEAGSGGTATASAGSVAAKESVPAGVAGRAAAAAAAAAAAVAAAKKAIARRKALAVMRKRDISYLHALEGRFEHLSATLPCHASPPSPPPLLFSTPCSSTGLQPFFCATCPPLPPRPPLSQHGAAHVPIRGARRPL